VGVPPLQVPILALAAAGEAAQGETADKMKEWGRLTSGGFKLETVPNCDHMALVLSKKAQRLVVCGMRDAVH